MLQGLVRLQRPLSSSFKIFFVLPLLFFLFPSDQVLVAEPSEGQTETLPREAIEKLAADLETLKGNREALPQVIEKIDRETEQARSELDSLNSEIAKLRGSLDSKRERLERLKDGTAFQSAKRSLLENLSTLAPRTVTVGATGKNAIDFNRDVRPILSNKCFACHGPDEKTRKAGLRFDKQKEALAELKSGHRAIVPGNRAESQLMARVTSTDADEKMPPATVDKILTEAEIEILGRWIDEGAVWGQHWAFVPPKRPALPEPAAASWVRNPIDRFVLAKLEGMGLSPAPEADKRTLIRRVSLDLTGLPPTLQEVNDYLQDDSPEAYERVVGRLLDSPRYGEHMTRYWLDLARYADTNGFHIDNERYMWRWRDWVINAFNSNTPFDRFTIEQLAGDLLPTPSTDQIIATGFCRNNMVNFEGGAIPEEYQAAYVMDRVNTLGTTFLGMSVGCAQCHDHKYDPITQKEYYQLYAFFNTIPENGLDGRDGNAVPVAKAPTQEQTVKLAELEKEVQEARETLDIPMPELDAAQLAWEAEQKSKLDARWTVLAPGEASALAGTTLSKLEDQSLLAGGPNPSTDVYSVQYEIPSQLTVQALRLEVLTDASLPEAGAGRADNSNFVLSEFKATIHRKSTPEGPEPLPFSSAKADHSQEKFPVDKALDGSKDTGWAGEGFAKKENRTAIFIPHSTTSLQAGDILQIEMRHESGFAGHGIGRFRISLSSDTSMAPSTLGSWLVSGPFVATDGKAAFETAYPPEDHIDLKETYPDGRLMWLEFPEFADGAIHTLKGNTCATYLSRTVKAPTDREMTLSLGSNDAVALWVNGEKVHSNNVQRGVEADQDTVNIHLKKGENQVLLKVVDYGGSYAFYFNRKDEQLGEHPFNIEQILAMNAGQRSEDQARTIRNYYREKNSPEWLARSDELAKAQKAYDDFNASVPTVMVMSEMSEPRETFMLVRGQYDQPSEKVQAVLPAAFPPLPEGTDGNRLGLAKWLMQPSHPLTARVTVNRFWQNIFGTGIVKTAEDFGSQGEWPSHHELLDWLAVEFREGGWDVKHILHLMVTSAAYRQSAVVTPEKLEADPANRYLSRGPRFRMDAEVIRDAALAVSGLLIDKSGGPSVKPYQPAGLWEEVAYGSGFTAQAYEPDTGEDLYRRSMYTFWKRQSPPPSMMIFDAPNREVCTARRSKTNTPLQALALLNDPQFVEAARSFAERMMAESSGAPAERIAFAFELATARKPLDKECGILLGVFENHLKSYRENPDAAKELIEVGESAPDEKLDPCELAAYTNVASMILNLDETVTKG